MVHHYWSAHRRINVIVYEGLAKNWGDPEHGAHWCFYRFFNFLLPAPSTYTGSVIVFSLGVLLIGYGVGVYVSAGLGAGPRDSLMMLITEKTGWNVQWVRNGMEITILFAAWGMGGPIGLGTILTAILTGIILRFSLPQSIQLLNYAVARRTAAVKATPPIH